MTKEINLNDLAHEIYLENIMKYIGITEDEFKNYFVSKMYWVELNATMIVHCVVFCTEDYKQVIREIEETKNNK